MPVELDANQGAGAIRTAIDEGALAAWLSANVAGYAGPLTIDQFNGGQSNPTYRLTTPDARYVLRRKPPGATLKGAHDVMREARVIGALANDVAAAAVGEGLTRTSAADGPGGGGVVRLDPRLCVDLPEPVPCNCEHFYTTSAY